MMCPSQGINLLILKLLMLIIKVLYQSINLLITLISSYLNIILLFRANKSIRDKYSNFCIEIK
jgi:hypothetical protein